MPCLLAADLCCRGYCAAGAIAGSFETGIEEQTEGDRAEAKMASAATNFPALCY